MCGLCSLLCLQVMGSDGPSVVLATSTEEELAHWMAALCQAAIEEVSLLTSDYNHYHPCSVALNPFHSMVYTHLVPFHSILVNHSIPFHSSQSHSIPLHSSFIPHGPTFILSHVFLLYTLADSHLPDPHKLLLLCHVTDSE